MFAQLIMGALLIAITVIIHGVVLGWTLWRLKKAPAVPASLMSYLILFVRVAVTCVFAHLIEIVVWAAFYFWEGTMPSLDVATYFSAVTYATIGYGDITPPPHLRLLASMEGLTGILMCAWSGGFFFAMVTDVFNRHIARRSP